MRILAKSDSLIVRIAMRLPTWMPVHVFHARVGYDCFSWCSIHFGRL